MPSEFDSRLFRDVMGNFATGVTVVTAAAGETKRGMTANAVSSVSLDPPLLLVCIAQPGTMLSVVDEVPSFAVNILAREQLDLSVEFARDGTFDRMPDLKYEMSEAGSPILDGVVAYADCRVHERYAGGDHVIVVGEVLETKICRPDAEPLVFFRGRYRELGDPYVE